MLALRIGPSNIWPLFALHLKIEFENTGLPELTHQITGQSRIDRLLPQELTFPHRGNWSTKSAVVRFADQFDFFSLRWKIPEEQVRRVFKIHPPLVYESSLPILSSSHRAGEMMTDVSERKGDPFDIKQYHPSDGMKKIVWKIYAKRGELMTRHEEQSITPEGQVLVYTVANAGEDHVCGAALAYLRTLEDLELEIYFGCEGMGNSDVAVSATQAEDRLIDCVWPASASTPASVSAEVTGLVETFSSLARDARVERLIIFCAVERLATKEGSDLLTTLGATLQNKAISPVFCFSRLDSTVITSGEPRPENSGLRAVIERWLLDSPETEAKRQPQYYSAFMGICVQNHWQVII